MKKSLEEKIHKMQGKLSVDQDSIHEIVQDKIDNNIQTLNKNQVGGSNISLSATKDHDQNATTGILIQDHLQTITSALSDNLPKVKTAKLVKDTTNGGGKRKKRKTARKSRKHKKSRKSRKHKKSRKHRKSRKSHCKNCRCVCCCKKTKSKKRR